MSYPNARTLPKIATLLLGWLLLVTLLKKMALTHATVAVIYHEVLPYGWSVYALLCLELMTFVHRYPPSQPSP